MAPSVIGGSASPRSELDNWARLRQSSPMQSHPTAAPMHRGRAQHDAGRSLQRALSLAQLGTVAYEQVPCCPALAEDVDYYWVMSAARPLVDTVVSRGMSRGATDLIVPLEGHFCAGAERHLFGDSEPRGYLVGPLSAPAFIRSNGRCTVVGARFRPGRARDYFRLLASELTDHVLAFDDLVVPEQRALSDALREQRSMEARLSVLERFLLAMQRRVRAEEQHLALALQIIASRRGCVKVDDLARAVGIGVRKLERSFQQAIGLSPKTQCRVARIEYAIEQIPCGKPPDWLDIVHRCGFYDQAHFIREFRAIVGTTPSGFVEERAQAAGAPVSAVASVQYA